MTGKKIGVPVLAGELEPHSKSDMFFNMRVHERALMMPCAVRMRNANVRNNLKILKQS